jgi:UDP-N-acetylglucosamine-lysosomal-enzyme
MTQSGSSDPETPVSHSNDLYGSSLLFVNRVYSAEYGYSPRKVPAHMPHFMLRSVFSEMKSRFASEWQATSSRKFRSGEDMQLAFAYYHFVVSEKKPLSTGEIFDLFDTDSSGTWSDREIRTLLARIHDVPLYLETIRAFENLLVNCSRQLHMSDRPAPLYERYYDSQLPVISRALVTKCTPVTSQLEAYFRHEPRHRHQILSDGDVAFKRLTSNASDVVRRLDDLRRNPAKFVCINDETDGRADNRLARAVLLDYLDSVLPVPSSFELPAEYRNRYAHIDDVRRSQFVRKASSVAAVICIAIIAIIAFASRNQTLAWNISWLWKTKRDAAKAFKV